MSVVRSSTFCSVFDAPPIANADQLITGGQTTSTNLWYEPDIQMQLKPLIYCWNLHPWWYANSQARFMRRPSARPRTNTASHNRFCTRTSRAVWSQISDRDRERYIVTQAASAIHSQWRHERPRIKQFVGFFECEDSEEFPLLPTSKKFQQRNLDKHLRLGSVPLCNWIICVSTRRLAEFASWSHLNSWSFWTRIISRLSVLWHFNKTQIIENIVTCNVCSILGSEE